MPEPTPTLSPRAAHRLFWLLAGVHTALWNFVPALTMPGPPLDVVELICWGHERQWGYHKHPPLPAWLADLAFSAGGLWAVFLLSQVFVVASMYAAFRVGLRLLTPPLALLAAFLLEGVHYYTLTSPEFNNNIAVTAFWALAVAAFHRALTRGDTASWLLTGVAIGLGALSKYSIAFLAIPIGAFVLVNPEARRALRTAGPFLVFAAAAAIALPHALWVVRHDFVTIDYAVERSSGEKGPTDHMVQPLRFALSQAGALLPMLIAAIPLIGPIWRWRTTRTLRTVPPIAQYRDRSHGGNDERFTRSFLLWTVLGPFALHLLISAILGVRLRSAWGTPLWTFAPLALLWFLEVRADAKSLRRGAWACAAVGAAMLIAGIARNTLAAPLRHEPLRTDFPGRLLAQRLHAQWHAAYGGEIPVVAGEWWPAGHVCLFAPGRPSLYSALDPGFATLDPRVDRWTSIEDINRRGGVLVWGLLEPASPMPGRLREAFPTAVEIDLGDLRWAGLRNLPPLRLGAAVVPPKHQR